jgi:tRNA(Ile)-lysidine synthase
VDGPRRLTSLLEDVDSRVTMPDRPLVVALSGGADSAALAVVANRHQETRAIHVDHGLGGSPELARAAAAIAERLGIELDVITVDVGEGPSPEGQARRVRYQALAGASRPHEAVLTAHTLDDSVETIVFNLIRGTGARGLAGIPLRRPPNVFRPFLGVRRSETREIAALSGLPFVDDPMNQDPALSRNVIRSRVVPVLTELNPRFSEVVASMGARLGRESSLLDRLVGSVPIEETDQAVSVPVGALTALDPALADRALLQILSKAVGPADSTSEGVGALRRVAHGVDAAASLPGGARGEVDGPNLVIRLATAPEPPRRLLPGSHLVGGLEFDVLASDRVCQVAPLSTWGALFPREVTLVASADGMVTADGVEAWIPGRERRPVAWYEPGTVGYLSVFARERA